MSYLVEDAKSCICGSDDVFLVRSPGTVHLKCNFCGRTSDFRKDEHEAIELWNNMVDAYVVWKVKANKI